jgi:hypothetical protein
LFSNSTAFALASWAIAAQAGMSIAAAAKETYNSFVIFLVLDCSRDP